MDKTSDGIKKRAGTEQTLFKRLYKARFIYLWLLVPFGGMAVFNYYPFFNGLIHSLYDWNGVNRSEFIGLSNFIELFTRDPEFWPAMQRMAVLTIADVTKSLMPAFLLAWILAHIINKKISYSYRILLMLPAVVPGMVGIQLWMGWMSANGLVNRILEAIGMSEMAHNWFGDPNTVVPALIFTGLPYINGANTLIFLAGFMGISKELYEALLVDGANGWQRFWYLEVPLLMSQVKLLLILAVIGAVQSYEGIMMMTGGGPGGSSMVPGLMLYNHAFKYWRVGYASAIGVVLFAIIMVFTILQYRYNKSSDTEYDAN